MSDRARSEPHPPGAGQRRPRPRRPVHPGLHLGVGPGPGAPARPALDRHLPARLRGPPAPAAGLSAVRGRRVRPGPGHRHRLPHQVGAGPRDRIALRRRDHHGPGRTRRHQRRRLRRRRPGDVLLRRRLPVHRRGPGGGGRRVGLAGPLRWPAGAPRRGEHDHPGDRRPGRPARAASRRRRPHLRRQPPLSGRPMPRPS